MKKLSWNEFFMHQVYLIASKSKDERTKIGAILVKDNRVISQGYNGIPMLVSDNVLERNERPTKYHYYVHAEANSVFGCARFGISSLGSVLYTQGIPCSSCSQAIIQAGISKIVCHKQWPNLTHCPNWVKSIEISKVMFEEAGVAIEWLDAELGVVGLLDGKEIFV